MESAIRERSIYNPIRLDSQHHRENTFTPRSISRHTAIPLTHPSSVQPFSLSLIPIPLFLASLIFLTLLGFGIFDSIVLHIDSVKAVVFPGEDIPVVPIQKASVEEWPHHQDVQKAVFTEHRISPDETLSSISYQYGLSPTTLISVNRLQHPDDLKVNGVLIVPYRDGTRHEARNGESFQATAHRLGVDSNVIQALPDGAFFVSGKPYAGEVPASFTDDMFQYPVSGRVIIPFGNGVDDLTDIPYQSDGIDLATESGVPVVASRKGKVVLTGHHSSYGLYVILDHSEGWKSFYGNLGRIDVAPGDWLDAGVTLGIAGMSGTARTPRLHFVLIRNGETVDPLDYLY